MTHGIEFELPDPSHQAYSWVYEDEHAPASQPPLFWDRPQRPGTTGSPTAVPFDLTVNGYRYRRADAEFPSTADTQVDQAVMARWREEWLPRIQSVADALEHFRPEEVRAQAWESTLWEQDREIHRVFVGVHGSVVLPANLAAERFQESFSQRFGRERAQDGAALLHGFPNLSTERAAQLWDLSRLVREDRDLQETLASRRGLQGLGASPHAEQFRARFLEFLEVFGCTSNTGLPDQPTWAEDPQAPLSVTLSYALLDDERSPRAAEERQRARRRKLEQELLEQASSQPALFPLIDLMRTAQLLVPVKEDHNLLADQRSSAASRARWLRVGEHLKERGAVATAADVFYYRRSELLVALEGGPPLDPGMVAERRRVQTVYRATPPPPVLGKPLAEASSQEHPILKGTPASPGRYRGRARVILSLDQAADLAAGEVLVSVTTTPPWSPYFNVAGAVVTNSGGPLSHCAIVAREFGIPAVVGAKQATRLIQDGSMVTVDGASGTVFLEPL